MIRNVVVGRLRHADDPSRAAADSAQLDAALAAVETLPCVGRVSSRVGRDAGLREGGWDFAITNDWVDEDAYRVYDLDPEHNRLRAEGFGPVCTDIARVQLVLPDV
jgi:hypothetical protein